MLSCCFRVKRVSDSGQSTNEDYNSNNNQLLDIAAGYSKEPPAPPPPSHLSQLDDDLSCPVCLEIPMGPVLSCQNGHFLCDPCARTMNECPMCRSDFSVKMRNASFEKYLDMIRFPCYYAECGCVKDAMSRQDLGVHQFRCEFNPTTVSLCSVLAKLWGSSNSNHQQLPEACPIAFVPGRIMQHQSEAQYLIDHLINSHQYNFKDIRLPGSPTYEITTSKYASVSPTPELTCNHFIRVTNGITGKTVGLFLIIFRLDVDDTLMNVKQEMLSIACVRLTPSVPNPGMDDSKIKMFVQSNPEKGNSHLSLSVERLSIQDLETLMRANPGTFKFKSSVPLPYLRRFYMKPRVLGGDPIWMTFRLEFNNV